MERSATGTSGWTQTYSGANTNYSETGLTANTKYYYRIKASNTAGSSSYSSNINVTTLNTDPVALLQLKLDGSSTVITNNGTVAFGSTVWEFPKFTECIIWVGYQTDNDVVEVFGGFRETVLKNKGFWS